MPAPPAFPALAAPPPGGPASSAATPPPWLGYAVAAVAAAAFTLAALPLRGRLELANIVMLYLLVVVLVALRHGRGPAALAAVLNVGAFDFVFVPPQLSFAVTDLQYLLTFGVMLGVGLITGQLTAGLRFQAEVAAARERRAQSLFELSRELSGALLADQVAAIGRQAVRQHFGGEAEVVVSGRDDHLQHPVQPAAGYERAAAEAAFALPVAAGAPPLHAHGAQPGWHYLPLQAPVRVRGVLALRPADARWLALPEQAQHLQTLARQVAIALERVHYVEVAQEAQLSIASERLRNTLLASISHDLRTPLTALVGLAESLAASAPPLAPAQAGTALALASQARELATLVNKLLEMARLQSGERPLQTDWQSVEEVVGSTLRLLRPALAGWPLEVDVPAALPLADFDATLVERALANLLENAVRHGAPPLVIRVRTEPGWLAITVRDHGPGLPATDQDLFGKFTRGASESATPGVGLGLAICKAVADAHHGSIRAANAEGGGALFELRLPRREPPPLPTDVE
ncbi:MULTISPECIES: DUF4118 domain-containing protein [Ramlibacter]|uniref:histidine kinase n=1 Tax=Ramlibacter aquaticus TaxID=2780094 RepID=A0ABR9S9N1_9BURK|nr:DUF4118 domain-containing protein [Ramlibacter aquaticus]MBE7939045.1 DUF4118 domain-containing protein [Ramlibacter aquaticus]